MDIYFTVGFLLCTGLGIALLKAFRVGSEASYNAKRVHQFNGARVSHSSLNQIERETL